MLLQEKIHLNRYLVQSLSFLALVAMATLYFHQEIEALFMVGLIGIVSIFGHLAFVYGTQSLIFRKESASKWQSARPFLLLILKTLMLFGVFYIGVQYLQNAIVIPLVFYIFHLIILFANLKWSKGY